jgi:hypothetical protein
MSVMDSTTPAPNHHEPVPVNRFALFSETLLAGVLVLVLSIPLVTIPPRMRRGSPIWNGTSRAATIPSAASGARSGLPCRAV